MPKAKLKTAQSTASPSVFIAAVDNRQRRTDAEALLKLFNRITGFEPKMWGSSIVGYGRYHYRYDSGREGEYFITGFSPRKASSIIYIMPGYRDIAAMLGRLGKHKTGRSCLYINKLSDVDQGVLEEIVRYGVGYMRANYMRANYETFDC